MDQHFATFLAIMSLTCLHITNGEGYFKNCILDTFLRRNGSDPFCLAKLTNSSFPNLPDLNSVGLTEVHEGILRRLLPGLLVLIFLTCFMQMRSQRLSKRAKSLLSKFPGPKPLPIVGNLHVFSGCSSEDIFPIFVGFIQNYGRRVLLWMLNKPTLFVSQAKDVEKVLSSSKELQKGAHYRIVMGWAIQEGLLLSDKEIWKVDRKLMTPSFKYQKFHGFLDTFNKNGNVLVDILREKFEKDPSSQNLYKVFAMSSMDNILESSYGVTSNLQNNPNHELIAAIITGFASVRARIFRPWLTLPIIWEVFGFGRDERKTIQILRGFFRSVTQERKRLIDSNELQHEVTKPFMDVFSESKNEQNVFDHMLSIFVAGFETTASAMNFALYLLALHPEHQAKVQKELDTIFGDNPDTKVTFDHLLELKYLEMCIKEALRIYPTAPVMSRLLESDVQLADDLVIPGGTEVVIDVYHLHRDPEMFPDPETFDPERFLPEACANRHMYAYVPFSKGPRGCIGQKYAQMQMKVLMSCILRNFTLSTSLERKDMKPLAGMFLEPNVPLLFKLIPRRN